MPENSRRPYGLERLKAQSGPSSNEKGKAHLGPKLHSTSRTRTPELNFSALNLRAISFHDGSWLMLLLQVKRHRAAAASAA